MSELEAVSLGGHLATINDADEQQWVFATFSPLAGAHRMWIGLYQPPGSVEPAGGWVWMSGDPSTYRNWDPIEPDNDTTGGKHQNNCVIYPTTAAYPSFWGDRDGVLEAGNAGGVYGIAEVVPNIKLSISQSNNTVLIAWPTETPTPISYSGVSPSTRTVGSISVAQSQAREAQIICPIRFKPTEDFTDLLDRSHEIAAY